MKNGERGQRIRRAQAKAPAATKGRVRGEGKKSITGRLKNAGNAPGVQKFLGLLPTSLCREALFAEDRFVSDRFEGDLALDAALRADGIVQFTRTGRLRPASLPAGLAALGSAQVLLGIEFLFTIREGECCTAIAARKFLVCHNT